MSAAEGQRTLAEARGPPPLPVRAFKSPPQHRSDVMAVWELTQRFAPLLGIPPIPLWRFEAALFPETCWPQPPRERAEEAAGGEAEWSWEEEMARGSMLAKTPRDLRHLQTAQHRPLGGSIDDGGDLDAAFQQGPNAHAPLLMGAWGQDGMASAAVLSDVHSALLRLLGRAARDGDGSAAGQPPRHSGLAVGHAVWAPQLAAVVSSAPLELADEDARSAARELSTKDYCQMTGPQRVCLVKALADIALMSPALRQHIANFTKAPTPPAKKKGQKGGKVAHKPVHAAETLPLPESTGAAEHASTSVETGAITLSWWERVHEALASGLGGCLGEDWWGRRLHILGGKMGAHRVYVENPNTGSWGWYDSKSWGALLLWLRSAGIQGEEGLVKKLALLVGKHEAFVREAAARGGEPSGVEREDGEGDGYAGVVAPLLWGGADIRGGRLSPGCIEVTLEALLGALDPDPTDPEQLKLVAEAAEACDDLVAMVARESPHVGPSREQSVGKVKELLSTIERRFWSLGALRSPWAHLRDHVLAQVGDADEASVGQYLALFQHYVVHDDILSPSAYLDVIRSSGARSTFLPPSRGDVVALMRSGLAAHLRSLKTKLPSAEALLEDARNGPRMERATVIAIRRCIEEPQQEPGERRSMGFPVCWVTMKCEGDGEQLPRLLSVPICALWEHSAFLVPLEVASVASSIPWAAGDACMAVDVAGQGRGRGARKGVVRRVVGVPSHAACAGGSWIDVPGGDGDAAGTGGRGGESRERGGQEAAQVSHRLDPWVRCWAGPEVGRERGQAAMPDDHAAGTAAENEMAGPSREEHFCGAVTHQQGIAELACRGRTEETRGEGETGGGQTDESVTALKVADAVAGRGLVAGPGEWEGTLPPFAIVLNRGDSVDFASYSDFRADESLLVHGAVRQGGIPQAQEIIVPLACVGPGDMPDSRGAPESAVGALLCGAWVQGSWGQGVTQHMALTSGGQAIRVGAQAALMMSGGSLTQILADGCDVWKCLEVEWDEGGGYTIDLVSPWEIEPDVMEESSRDGDMARDERREERRQEGRGAMRSALSGSWWQVDHSAERLRIASAGPFEGGWTRGEAEGSGGAPPAPFANAAKEHSGGAVGQDVLRAIHGREHFMDVLLSFHRAHGLTMRVPVFAHESMDLWKLFLEVTRLGGYTSVTESKLWRAVCDALGVDLTGQTSASFSLRNNYERCVLPLENHLLKHGAQGLSNFPVITGSFKSYETERTREQEREGRGGEGRGDVGSAECATEGTAEREGKDGDFPKLAPFGKTFVTMEDLEEADRIGLRLVAMGSNLIGYCLWRFWEDFEMWFPAIVADFDYKTAEHLLVYDMGTDDETFEWADLREFKRDELRSCRPRSAAQSLPPKIALRAGPVPAPDEEVPSQFLGSVRARRQPGPH